MWFAFRFCAESFKSKKVVCGNRVNTRRSFVQNIYIKSTSVGIIIISQMNTLRTSSNRLSRFCGKWRRIGTKQNDLFWTMLN